MFSRKFDFIIFTDTDECVVGSHVCDSVEDCENEEPFYSCFCHVREQFIGQGIQCLGKNKIITSLKSDLSTIAYLYKIE